MQAELLPSSTDLIQILLLFSLIKGYLILVQLWSL